MVRVKEKIFSERELCGQKCLVDVRGQRRMGRLVRDNRKATVTQITTRYNQGSIHTGSPKLGNRILENRCLIWGFLALVSWTFTKCMDAALIPLQLQCVNILNYLDDWPILAQSQDQALTHRDLVLDHLQILGLRTEPTKECSAATPVNKVLGGRHGFSHDTGTSVSCMRAVIADLSKSVQDRVSSPSRLMS